MDKIKTQMSPIKCFLLDHGYTSQTSGPCCMIPEFKGMFLQDGTKIVTNYTTLHNTPLYIEIKQTMDRGEWHPSCLPCKTIEDRQMESMRLNHLPYYQKFKNVNDKGLIDLTIWTGRACNLQCRTCNPWCSTSWDHEHFVMDIDSTQSKNTRSEIDRITAETIKYEPEDFKDVGTVILVGGEPLYNKQSFPLLDLIGEQSNRKATLVITTNATIPIDIDTLPFLEKYHKVAFTLSIDGIGKSYEFIRTGGQWDKILKNIETYKKNNIILNYHFTNSALNIFDAIKTRRWLEDNGISDSGLKTFVKNPEYLSYKIFNDSEKNKFRDWWGKQNFTTEDFYIVNALEEAEFDENARSQFFKFMDHTNRYHGLDWKHYLPDLYRLFHAEP